MAWCPLSSPDDPDAVNRAFVDGAADRLEEAWQTTSDPQLPEFLGPCDEPTRTSTLVELIKVDLWHRWKSGRGKKLEAYLGDWPELRGKPRAIVALLREECASRAVFETIPTREDLESRFPQLSAQIDLKAIEAAARPDRLVEPSIPAPLAESETPREVERDTPSQVGSAPPLAVGEAFGRDGRYEIREPLGKGGMGAVYRAYDTRLEREVAVKIPRLADPGMLKRFLREAQAAARIGRHPNICQILDADEVRGTYYITMDLIAGESLQARIEAKRLDSREAAKVVRKLAQALQKVHGAGLVHRDIKPSNVMIDESGEPVLMDFGLARSMLGESYPSGAGPHSGTLAYMSPEQAAGQPTDARSDIYSLGVVLYQMVTGGLPFPGPALSVNADDTARSEPPESRGLRPQLDAGLERICLKAMANSPADRYQTAGEMSRALKGYLEGVPKAARVPSRRRLAWLVAAAAAVTILLVGLTTGFGKAGFSDDFEDNWINPDHWICGGDKRGWNRNEPADTKYWSYSHDETLRHADDPDGFLQMRVWGPSSPNTYGGEAWIRSTRNYNDGRQYTLNFTWAIDVTDDHVNEFYIQITGGYLPPRSDNIVDAPSLDVRQTTDLLWRTDRGAPTEKRGARYLSDVGKSTWSIVLDPSGTAKLYDGPNASGSLLRSEALHVDAPWYLRFMLTDSTSERFPAGDTRLELYHFEASPGPAK